ncbi:MAG: hypothetical protein IPM29_22325 [Planctomycetes bacterium]|nr:hypothetical protein [Planctomycetota bacterium]
MAHKDDVVRLFKGRGWTVGAGGDVYFPAQGKPHLHLRVMSGMNEFGRLVQWMSFLVVSRPPGEGANTYLVRNGVEVPGAIDGLGRGEIKTEATAVCRNVGVP